MSTLTEFLLARIKEDEVMAPLLHDYIECDLARQGLFDPDFGWECTCGHPARVLAECEAKRRIVELISSPGMQVFRLLALPYADHPDYREEWITT